MSASSCAQRVLLVEDSVECQMVVERALTGVGVGLTKAGSLAEARKILEEPGHEGFDLILLDLVLPDGDGLSLIGNKVSPPLPEETSVFLLTCNNELEAKLSAFDSGVDDYLVKPVNPFELRARVCARLRKVKHSRANASLIQKVDLTLHVPMMKASLRLADREKDLNLTGKEFKILYFLVRREGETLSRGDLIKEVWGEGIHVLERTVDSHIAGLRRKLGPANSYVKSVPGMGYRFVASKP
jgi:DNA-binding response OmpR family regulator